MKKVCLTLLSSLLCFGLFAGATSQQSSLSADEKATEQADSPAKKPRKQPAGRVPNHFGKLGLSDEQRTKIYSAQAKYEEQIAALEEQIEELEALRYSEIYSILTKAQQTELAKILEGVRQQREAKLNSNATPETK